MFLEGQDDALLYYDCGEFYQWLKDCEAGGWPSLCARLLPPQQPALLPVPIAAAVLPAAGCLASTPAR